MLHCVISKVRVSWVISWKKQKKNKSNNKINKQFPKTPLDLTLHTCNPGMCASNPIYNRRASRPPSGCIFLHRFQKICWAISEKSNCFCTCPKGLVDKLCGILPIRQEKTKVNEFVFELHEHRIKGVVVALSFLSGAIVWEFSNIKQKNINYGSFDNNDYNNNENNKTKNNNCLWIPALLLKIFLFIC